MGVARHPRLYGVRRPVWGGSCLRPLRRDQERCPPTSWPAMTSRAARRNSSAFYRSSASRTAPRWPFRTSWRISLYSRLGPGAQDVANALGATGVRGRRGETSFANPVVRHLNRTLDIGRRMTIPVGSDRLFVELPDTTLEVPLPPPVKEFLDGFRAGLYPPLEAPGSRSNRNWSGAWRLSWRPRASWFPPRTPSSGGRGSCRPPPEGCAASYRKCSMSAVAFARRSGPHACTPPAPGRKRRPRSPM